MSKVYSFLGFLGMLALGTIALAFIVRNFAPVSWRGLFSYQGA